MSDPSHLGQWLRFLSVPGADPARLSRAGSRAVMGALVAFTRHKLLADLSALAASPIVITYDGATRSVRVLDSIEYGYNREGRDFHACLREPDGHWRHVPATDPNVVIFDTYLPKVGWRNRIGHTLKLQAHQALMDLVARNAGTLDDGHEVDLRNLCHEVVDEAWCGLHLRARLRALFPTKRIRCQIREAMAVEPELLALARSARFRGRFHAIDQKWLTFAWQHQVTLSRIRRQTPTLLRAVAQHLYQYPVNPTEDPTRACVKTLITNGLSKRSYRLLVQHSDRPFREVIRRFAVGYALDALLLGLKLIETGHDVTLARPLFYRVTLDQFGTSMTPAKIRNRLAVVPARVFVEACTRLAQANDDEALGRIAWEYRTIVDWWVEHEQTGHAQAGWERWLALACEAEDLRRVSLERDTWPCAVEELRTPDAEVLALANPRALFEEGRTLRHCVYAYADNCRDDQARLFSARMWHQGRVERATIGLWREPRGWRIWDIRGTCNRRMGGHWIPLARQVAEAYTRNALSTQLPLPMEAFLRMPSDVR